MTQLQLNEIYAEIVGGKPANGWSAERLAHIEILREPDTDKMWVRQPKGPWVEVPAKSLGAVQPTNCVEDRSAR